MDQYKWICGIVFLAAFHGFLGTSALSCNQCQTATGDDCRLILAKHRVPCPAESNVCASYVELDNSKGWLWSNPTMKFTRNCAQMVDAQNRPQIWPSGKKECKYTEEGSIVKVNCYCNTDYCNSHNDLYLPDGRLIRTSAAASQFTTAAIAPLLVSCAMALSFLF